MNEDDNVRFENLERRLDELVKSGEITEQERKMYLRWEYENDSLQIEVEEPR